MDDLISRQEAIDALDEQIRQCDKALSAFDISMKDEYAVKVERASLVAFRETFEYMPSAQQWIPCSERLPEGITQVIIQTNGEAIHEAIYMGKDDYGHYVWKRPDNEIYWDEEVVAWMPLPTPYQPKEDICK